ncbi:MAG: hypothetical protein R3C59_25830 [Planctomycetaceae bacterium]
MSHPFFSVHCRFCESRVKVKKSSRAVNWGIATVVLALIWGGLAIYTLEFVDAYRMELWLRRWSPGFLVTIPRQTRLLCIHICSGLLFTIPLLVLLWIGTKVDLRELADNSELHPLAIPTVNSVTERINDATLPNEMDYAAPASSASHVKRGAASDRPVDSG